MHSSASSYQFQCSGQMLLSEFGGHVQQYKFTTPPPPPPPPLTPTFAPCPICGESSNGTFFGVPTCRACGSFFRRSMLDKRKYLCRKENNCAIINKDGMRNSCRACRLKRCFEVGMDISQKHWKIPPRAEKSSQNATTSAAKSVPPQMVTSELSASETPPAELAPVTEELNPNYPNAFKFLQYFRNVENGQRALVSVLEGTRKIILDNQQLHMITHDEMTKIERGSITLLLDHLRDQFPQFDEQPSEVKISIVKSYSFQAAILRICFSTLKLFPDQNHPIKHLVLNGCCLVSIDDYDYFCSSYDSSKEERKKYGLKCVHSLGLLICRLRPLHVSETELSALIGIQLWNCIERFVPLCVEQKNHRNAFFVELHAMAAQRNGNISEIAIRFGLLLKILLDTSNLVTELQETFALTDIFFPSVHSFVCSDAVIDALLN